MTSRRYKQLQRRVTELRHSLLPRKFDPTGSYSARVYERTKAFRLLVHAEFEAFIEDRVAEVLDLRVAAFQASRQTSRCLVSLVAYHEGLSKLNDPTSLLDPPQKPSPLVIERIERAKNALRHYTFTKNHGIKEENLLRLLMPLGIEAHEFDLVWLASINSWAEVRGNYAHQSSIKITTLPDPDLELRSARELLRGFRQVDLSLDSL